MKIYRYNLKSDGLEETEIEVKEIRKSRMNYELVAEGFYTHRVQVLRFVHRNVFSICYSPYKLNKKQMYKIASCLVSEQ